MNTEINTFKHCNKWIARITSFDLTTIQVVLVILCKLYCCSSNTIFMMMMTFWLLFYNLLQHCLHVYMLSSPSIRIMLKQITSKASSVSDPFPYTERKTRKRRLWKVIRNNDFRHCCDDLRVQEEELKLSYTKGWSPLDSTEGEEVNFTQDPAEEKSTRVQ